MLKKSVVLLATCLGMLGCEAEGEKSAPASFNAPSARTLNTWNGRKIGAQLGKWEDIGAIKLSDSQSVIRPLLNPEDVRSASTVESTDEPFEVTISRSSTGRRYKVRFEPGELDALTAAMEQMGAMEENNIDGELEDEQYVIENQTSDYQPRSWSNNTDSRIRRGINDNGYTKTTNPYKYIGRFTTGGTGTMISCSSSREYCYVLTAAHVAFDRNGNEKQAHFEPRRDDNLNCGSQCAGTAPYGRWIWDDTMYVTAWYNDECYNPDVFASRYCSKTDMAIIRVRKCSSCTVPGWIGRTLMTKSSLNSYTKYMRGYPACGCTASPAGCSSTPHILWGDGALSLGSFYFKDADDWHQVITHSGDSSPGNSGSPLYVYKNNSYYIFAVHSAGYDSQSGGATPDWATRLTPRWADIINWYVSIN